MTIVPTVLLVFGCSKSNFSFKNEKEKITHAWTDWSKKALTGKPELIAYYFADDALCWHPILNQ